MNNPICPTSDALAIIIIMIELFIIGALSGAILEDKYGKRARAEKKPLGIYDWL